MDGAGSKPGVPLAACPGSVFERLGQFIYCVPHNPATLVHIPVRIPNNPHVSVKLETVQHLSTSLSHKVPRKFNGVVDFLHGGLDEHGVVHRGADPNTRLREMDTCQSEHFCAVGLHWEIPHTSGVEFHHRLQLPAKGRRHLPA